MADREKVLVGVTRTPGHDDGVGVLPLVPLRLLEVFQELARLEGCTKAELFERLLLRFLDDRHLDYRGVYAERSLRTDYPGEAATPIDDLDLSVRLANVLHMAGLRTAADVVRFGRARLRAFVPPYPPGVPSGPRRAKYFTLRIERELDEHLQKLGLELLP